MSYTQDDFCKDAQVMFDRSRVGYVNAVYDGLLAVAEIERLLGDAPAEDAPAEDAPAEETGE